MLIMVSRAADHNFGSVVAFNFRNRQLHTDPINYTRGQKSVSVVDLSLAALSLVLLARPAYAGRKGKEKGN